MTGLPAELLAVLLLLATLVVAVARPRGMSEAVVAVPAAAVLVATGAVPLNAATRALREIGPTVGFLAAILVFGHLCAEARVFDYLGGLAARASHASPTRLLALAVALAAGVTVVLTLDATVVLLTPVVLATTSALRLNATPHLYACTRLANSGSLLLPVSNLTNLLAFTASGLSFGRFAVLMLAPWLLVCAGEWAALRRYFRRDLVTSGDGTAAAPSVPAPRYALAVLAGTVAGFVLTSSFHVSPAWAALAGCGLLALPRLRQRRLSLPTLVRQAGPGFVAFVLALAVIVDGVTRHGLGSALAHLLPASHGLAGLFAIAFLAAALANAVNNLPATLALVPLVGPSAPAVLAVLLGVNIGPNATYPGSLATLLWRRLLPRTERPVARQFHLLGVLSTPPLLAAATVALWLGVRVIGT